MAAAREQVADSPPAAEAVSVPLAQAASLVGPFAVVALQRPIGNRALGQVLARYEDEAAKEARETAAWEADEARVKKIETTGGADLVKQAESEAAARGLADTFYSSRRGYRVAHALVTAADAAGRSESQIDAMFAKLGFTGLMLPCSVEAFVARWQRARGRVPRGQRRDGARDAVDEALQQAPRQGRCPAVPRHVSRRGQRGVRLREVEAWLPRPHRHARRRQHGQDHRHDLPRDAPRRAGLPARARDGGRREQQLEDIATELEMPVDLVREAKTTGAPKLNAEQLARVKSYYAGQRLLIAHAPGTSDDQKDYLSRPTEHEGHLLTSWIAQFGGR
jgi:hypothetical protein